MRKEILARLKYSSTLLIEIIVVSFGLVEISFIHGPLSLLLLLPGVLSYFFFLIWNQYVVILSIGDYLRNKVEPRLKLLSRGMLGWETFRRNKIGPKQMKLMALTYSIISLAFLFIIVIFLSTFPKESVFYVGPHLCLITIVYSLALFILSYFVYFYNNRRRRKVEVNKVS